VSDVASPIPDYYSLFGLEPAFAVDAAALTRAYRTVQAQVHPDRFAGAGAAERRAALQWATLANEAYEVLRSPARRAAYLCERAGMAVTDESARTLTPEFLDLQMQWRQDLEDMQETPDPQRLERLRQDARELREREIEALRRRLDDERDFAGAASGVRRLMFVDNFLSQIGGAGESRPAAPAL
jgi:molecular chaperone HscB